MLSATRLLLSVGGASAATCVEADTDTPAGCQNTRAFSQSAKSCATLTTFWSFLDGRAVLTRNLNCVFKRLRNTATGAINALYTNADNFDTPIPVASTVSVSDNRLFAAMTGTFQCNRSSA